MDRRARIGWAAVVLAAAAWPSLAEILPTERCREYFFTTLHVSGDPDRPLSLLIDTGASHTVIDPDSLRRVSGKTVREGQWARFGELDAGNVVFRKLRARSHELDPLQRVLGRPFDGILGFPAFAGRLVVFDYGAGEVRLEEGRLAAPDGRSRFRLVREKKRPFVRFDFGAFRLPVLLDTGSLSSFSIEGLDRLSWAVDPRPLKGALRIDRLEVREIGRLADDVPIGTATLTRPIVESTDRTNLVGARVLRHFRWTFDQKRRVVQIDPLADGPVEMEPFRGTGLLTSPGTRGLEVVRLFEGGSAAAAGVRRGDRIVAIDGVPVYERSLCDETGDRQVLTIERPGRAEPLEIAVDVVALVP